MLSFFISPTTQTVTTRSGHAIAFIAATSTHVPVEAQNEILALGIPRDVAETLATEPAAEAAQIALLPDPGALQAEFVVTAALATELRPPND